MVPSYAVLFKTHFWDEFNQRQLERLKARVGRGKIYVVVDSTFGPCPVVDHEHVIKVTEADLANLGLAPITTHGSILWYNPDYMNYVAAKNIPPCDYYVCVEYDVAINVDLDSLIDTLAADEVDYLGFPIRKPAVEWPWYDMHVDVYGTDMLVYLSCLSAFSNRALHMLQARREAMGREFAAGTLGFWPNNEALVPNEVRAAGMKLDTLTRHGRSEQYDWWPPLEEAELPKVADQSFVHPVLHGARYVRSLVHHQSSLKELCYRNSALRRKLDRFNPKLVRAVLRSEVGRRLRDGVLRRLAGLGLRRQWYAGAQAGAARNAQRRSAHNSA